MENPESVVGANIDLTPLPNLQHANLIESEPATQVLPGDHALLYDGSEELFENNLAAPGSNFLAPNAPTNLPDHLANRWDQYAESNVLSRFHLHNSDPSDLDVTAVNRFEIHETVIGDSTDESGTESNRLMALNPCLRHPSLCLSAARCRRHNHHRFSCHELNHTDTETENA
jgi:hypothetical protein